MGGRVCAVCGRSLDDVAEPIEAAGHFFCSPGHLLDHEGRTRRLGRSPRWRRTLPPGAGLMMLLAVLYLARGSHHPFAAASSTRPSPSALRRVLPHTSRYPAAVHSRGEVFRCLVRREVWAGNQTPASVDKSLSQDGTPPPGVTGGIIHLGFGAVPSARWLPAQPMKPPAGVTGPLLDDVTLVFFKTPALAVRGEERVVGVYVFGYGLSPRTRAGLDALYRTPPVSAVPKFVFLAGNVVVMWSYPRAHTARDDRILTACLSAATA